MCSPVEGFRDPASGIEVGRHAGLALLESLTTLEQERFGFGVFLLARQTGTEQAHHVELICRIRPVLSHQARTLAQKRFGRGVFLLCEADRA